MRQAILGGMLFAADASLMWGLVFIGTLPVVIAITANLCSPARSAGDARQARTRAQAGAGSASTPARKAMQSRPEFFAS